MSRRQATASRQDSSASGGATANIERQKNTGDAGALTKGSVVRLFTWFGTVIYYDEDLEQFRHGPSHLVPLNAALYSCGSNEDPGSGAFLLRLGNGVSLAQAGLKCSILCDPGKATLFQCIVVDRERVSLKCNDLYLCAEEEGTVTLSRELSSVWETFTIAHLKQSIGSLLDINPSIAGRITEARSALSNRARRYIRVSKGRGERAIITDTRWLQNYLAREHYHIIKIMHEVHGFDIIDSKSTDFYHPLCINEVNRYKSVLLAYWGNRDIPVNLLTCATFIKLDDLRNSDAQDARFRDMIRYCDVVVSPYAYEFTNFFAHSRVEWIPYSTSVEEDFGPVELNESPLEAVLLSGSVAWDRPFRQFVFSLDDPRLIKLGHPGYYYESAKREDAIIGTKWFREIRNYLCAFCDAHSLRYVHLKVFEIASTGALLLADRLVEREMNELGFVDGATCIFCDQDDFLDKVDWVLAPENRLKVDEIRAAGMRLALERHTTRVRAAQLAELIQQVART